MAKQSSKQPSTGQGRKANSEPKVQTFSNWSGCNFQLSPRDMAPSEWDGWKKDNQSDLQMDYVVIQNNATIADNKTIETRENLVTLFDAPNGVELTDICTLIQDEFYVAGNDKNIYYGKIGSTLNNTVVIDDVDGETKDNTWTFLGHADDQLVGMTKGLQLWTGPYGQHRIQNARTIPTPPALAFSQLQARGSLAISATLTDACPFRIALRYTHLNKYGPTLASPPLTFYANAPTTEWNSERFLRITGTAPTGYNIVAVEIYYTEDEYQDPAFLARVEMPQLSDGSRDGGGWSFNWVGYHFDVSMWSIANLSIPNENYTPGVPASKMIQHDGRLYFWGGDPSYRLWIGGNPGNIFSVSTGTGGGFTDVEPGTGQSIKVVPKWKSYNGADIVCMLCDNANSSKEQRHNLVDTTITLSSEQSATGWKAEKVNNTVGCKSYYGAGVWADGLYAVSRYGIALTTLTMEYNSQIRIQYVSDPIKPAFLDLYGYQLSNSVMLCIDDILYIALGKESGDLENLVFCYDINLKAWWSITLDLDEPILNMVNIDHESYQEGIGIITPNHVYMLPTTKLSTEPATFETYIETGELATSIPMQTRQYLSSIEFRFDYFIGDLEINLIGIDQFGRTKTDTKLKINHDNYETKLSEWMRVDQDYESYKIVMKGKARFRLTHMMARCYPRSAQTGMHQGFNVSQSFRKDGDIHPTFKDYNDIKNAIIP